MVIRKLFPFLPLFPVVEVTLSARFVLQNGRNYLEPLRAPSFSLEPSLSSVIRWLGIALILTSFAPVNVCADDLAGIAEAAARIRSEFTRLDGNHDLRIDGEEFRSLPGDPSIRRRDFRLYDFDLNGVLSREEFACVSGLVEAPFRGSMPDPVDDLVDDAVAALDESYDHWNQRPTEQVSAHTFVSNFLGSISLQGKRFVTGRIVERADQNSDGTVSRAEARHFLEQQLGVRLRTGPPLRESTGRVLRYDGFLEMDTSHDGAIDAREFRAEHWQATNTPQRFAMMDRDGSGHVSMEEYAAPSNDTYFDPIEWFREADANLDACLSADEMITRVAADRLHLVRSTVAAFDSDQDGKLSLREYRLSMLGQHNNSWGHRPLDEDRDGRLSYDEFVFAENDLFQLQRRYFFHRLDLSRDGTLSLDEFEFLSLAPVSIALFSTAGDDSRILYQDQRYPDCGWPSVSPDGKRVLFHACPAGDVSAGRIISVTLDGGRTQIVCDGIQPSWSADGESFVCERRSGDAGVWIVDASGLRGRRITEGHAPKWSPDGASIAFLRDNGVSIFDVVSEEIRPIWFREDHHYQDLGSDIAWSPDGARLAVLGNMATISQLVLLSATADETDRSQIRFTFNRNDRVNLNWNDRDGILFGMRDSKSGQLLMMSLRPDSDQDADRVRQWIGHTGLKSACLTPQGSWYVVAVEE